MQALACGFRLMWGAERVDEEALEALWKLAKEARALEQMRAMQEGALVNEGENRQALHTAMRDLFGTPLAKESALAAQELSKLEKAMAQMEPFTDMVQIGIGGSDLGPRALALALEPFYRPGKRAHFLSNVDPDDANRILSKLDLKKTLFVVVSKSGTTLETLTNETWIRSELEKRGIRSRDHFIAVTGKGSPMDDPSGYLASFYIWDFVGGRYSATSMVGGVILSFLLGIQGFKEILKGAHQMDRHALEEGNLPLLSALLGIWNRNFLRYPTLAIIPYSQALLRFPAHLQQLDMESNGKRVDSEGHVLYYPTGPVVWGEPGTNGQHSFYQLIHQGTDVVPVEFIGFYEPQVPAEFLFEGTSSQDKLLANLFAQSIALAQGSLNQDERKSFPGNRPNRLLLSDRLTPERMGSLLAFYEHKVAFQGFIWGINSFDQEGVQLGKVLAKQVLEEMQGKGSYPLVNPYTHPIKLNRL